MLETLRGVDHLISSWSSEEEVEEKGEDGEGKDEEEEEAGGIEKKGTISEDCTLLTG